MKFYVASKFANYKQVQEVVEALRVRGHTITFHWANNEIEFVDGVLIREAKDLTPSQRVDFALADLAGAKEADAVVLLYVDNMRGAYVEVGAALAMGKIVYVIGRDIPYTIFWDHPNVRMIPTTNMFYGQLRAHGA